MPLTLNGVRITPIPVQGHRRLNALCKVEARRVPVARCWTEKEIGLLGRAPVRQPYIWEEKKLLSSLDVPFYAREHAPKFFNFVVGEHHMTPPSY